MRMYCMAVSAASHPLPALRLSPGYLLLYYCNHFIIQLVHCLSNIHKPDMRMYCMAVSAASHPLPALRLSPGYLKSYCYHFIMQLLHCLSNIRLTFPVGKISQKLCSHPLHSNTSTVYPLAILYTQNLITLYSQATGYI